MCYISFLLIVLKSYVAALSCCYFCKTFVAFGFACFTLHCGLWLLFVEERFRSAFVDVRPCRHNGTVTAHTIHSPPCFSHSLRLVLMFLVPSSTEFKLFPFSVIVCLVYQVMYFEVVLMLLQQSDECRLEFLVSSTAGRQLRAAAAGSSQQQLHRSDVIGRLATHSHNPQHSQAEADQHRQARVPRHLHSGRHRHDVPGQ